MKIGQKTPNLVKIGQKVLYSLQEDPSTFCSWHRQIRHRCLLVQNDTILTVTCASTMYTERIVEFTLQQRLLEQATILSYTFIGNPCY
jgi:hypothetical protein